MDDVKRDVTKPYHSMGLKYHGEDLKEIFTGHDDENWQFVRIGDEAYPRKCTRIQGDEVLVSIACLASEGEGESPEPDVEFVEAKIGDCEFFYVVDSEGHPIAWKIKK